MSDYTFVRLQKKLKNKNINLAEIVTGYIEAIDETNDEINAIIHLDKEKALEEAASIQQKIDNGTAGKLAGCVISIKDLICEKGKPTTCASAILSDFESVYDATVIKKLKNEDALLLGRTNMDEFAMGSSNENSIYGPVKNPLDTKKVSGGSSGGSAAAVAAGYCAASLGSDTGGSIRQPAAFCGVVGLKPSYGRVSRHGLVAFASSFDCIGPFANTVTDAAHVLEVIAGVDENDSTTADIPVPEYAKNLDQPKTNIKIGVPEEYFGEGLDEEIKAGIEKNLNSLENKGAELVHVQLPHTKYAISTYYILTNAEASSNLARYDGMRYGKRADMEEVRQDLAKEKAAIEEEMGLGTVTGGQKTELAEQIDNIDSPLARLYKKTRTEGFGDEVKRRIMLGTYVLSAGYYDDYYAKAQKVRRLIKQDFEAAFQKVDVIASPTTPTTAFDIGAKTANPLEMYLNDIYTASVNLAGVCGISIPCDTHSNGLPFSIQFIGDMFEEEKILNAARLIEELYQM